MESIDAVVLLCDSADEDLRQIAIETLLTFGKKSSHTNDTLAAQLVNSMILVVYALSANECTSDWPILDSILLDKNVYFWSVFS